MHTLSGEITLLPGISRDGVRETFEEIVICPGDTISTVGPTVKILDAAELVAGPLFVHMLIRPGDTRALNIPLSPEVIRDRFIGAL